ncbi:MAG: hypothetical protein GC171_00175 [Terrimonas sp.]|nr:hypothetical protein [Terrimonas sp.]
MYEHKHQPLASKKTYYRRIARNVLIASFILFICLLIGIVGYRFTAGQSWIDALHNASMILSGMGPVFEDPSKIPVTGKLFSSFYALFSGVVFITNIGFILTPAIHRIFHRIHIEEK